MKNTIIGILLVFLIINFYFDNLACRNTPTHIDNMRKIAVLLKTEAERIRELEEFNRQMYYVYFEIYKVAVTTQLKCNIFYEELIQAYEQETSSTEE